MTNLQVGDPPEAKSTLLEAMNNMTHCSVIMAIVQENREETALQVQEVLTKYGCYIRVRLGLHDAAVHECSGQGIILLQLCGADIPLDEFAGELQVIDGVKVKYMTIDI